MTTRQDELASELSTRYDISVPFCVRYLAETRLAYGDAASTDEFLASLGETQRLYLDYALSTNRRGEQVYQMYARDLVPGKSRVLDVGCGQGGAVKAFRAAGIEAMGIEIDENLAEYARLNLGTAADHVLCADILATPLETLGQFDLILCSDVIEHVGDPDALVRIAAQLLRPGGRFVLQVPNRHSIRQILADGHFRIFGITLLSRQEGRELKRQLQGWDDPYHHMGEHLPAEHYMAQMELNGLVPHLSAPLTADFENAMTLFGEACAKLDWMLVRAGLSWFTRRELARAFSQYGIGFLGSHGDAITTGDHRGFASRYLEPVWTITGVQTPGMNGGAHG